jgi:hypothetical protein
MPAPTKKRTWGFVLRISAVCLIGIADGCSYFCLLLMLQGDGESKVLIETFSNFGGDTIEITIEMR